MGFTRSLQNVWLTETIRLYEVRNGRCEDTQAIKLALNQGQTLEERLVIRANALAEQQSFTTGAQTITGQAQWALAGLVLMGLLGGVSAVMSALGNGQQPVNLLVALLTLLGLHLATLLLWFVSLKVESDGPPGLGKLWLALTRKLNRQTNTPLLAQGLTNALGRAGALKPMLGIISHTVWLGIMLAVIATLLVLLSARQYEFQWETTLLGAGVFLELTQMLGWLPSLLGFTIPNQSIIDTSIGSPSHLPGAGLMWSSWLIGCVVIYGLIPRALALFICIRWARRNMHHTSIDPTLPGYLDLRSRLMPESQVIGIDRPAPQITPNTAMAVAAPSFNQHKPYAILGLELSTETQWPPFQVGKMGTDLGRVDSREQRNRILELLAQQDPKQIIVLCDASQTPDRGTLHFLKQLATLSTKLYVIAQVSLAHNNRYTLWQEQLSQLPAGAANIGTHLDDLFSNTATRSNHAHEP